MIKKLIILTFLISIRSTGVFSQENWTHFRGSNLDAISEVNSIPVSFNDSTNIIWKTDIQGRGWSSPVVYGDQIWITTASKDGRELFAVCIDFESGDIIYEIKLFSPDSVIRKHSINSYATPTPCIENGFVYTHFGSLGTACINTSDGTVIWQRTDLRCNHIQGPGSSPFLYKNLLILHYEGTDVRYLVALNKSTGEEVWRTYRPDEPYIPLPNIGTKAYITPLLINVDVRDMLISNGSAVCIAYEPLTGEEIWRIVRGAESTVAMPFYENGVVFFYTGFMVKDDGTKFSELLAVNPKGQGDITETHVIWRKETEILQLLTPVVKDGLIYTVDTKNVLMCINALSGEENYTMRLRDKFNSSPVYANGRIYFGSIRGEVLVIKEGSELNVLANNQMEGEIWATPAILRNSIILRTDNSLYRIGKNMF